MDLSIVDYKENRMYFLYKEIVISQIQSSNYNLLKLYNGVKVTHI